MDLPDGLIAVVKGDCPTCGLVAPVLAQLAATRPLEVWTQDDPSFPEGFEGVVDDTGLERSWHLGVDTVPTLVKVEGGQEVARTVGWSREHWAELTGEDDLGPGLPDHRPGCGSLTVDPNLADQLAVRFEGRALRSRHVELAELEDEHEALFARGWTDGLPVVPPTPERVLRMLAGTTRAPDEVVAVVPPDLVECTVEKVAVNAVMAGCLPEYLPVVLAAVEAACTTEFNIHGVLATTWFAGPVIVVDGPIAKAIGMNSGRNALGQGNRANAAIGRALQLVIRNVGGGRPGEVDQAALGQPGKYTFCFAESEQDPPWEPLAQSRGVPAGTSAVTLFAGSGMQGMADQLSREPESLARSLALCLRAVGHPKMVLGFDAMVVVTPEHGRIFRQAGWDRDRVLDAIMSHLQLPGAELVRGAGGIAEGLPEHLRDATLPKFRPGGLLLTYAGGDAGLFSAIIGGWASGDVGSSPVTVPIGT